MSRTNDDDRWSDWEPRDDDDGTIRVVAVSLNAVFFVSFMACIFWCIWRYRAQIDDMMSENQEESDNESTTPQVNPVAELV